MDPFTPQQQDDRPERAQATVEFAMILPILCLILFAVVEFGMAFWTFQQVSAAASEGARRAAVSRTYGDRATRAEQAAESASPGLDAGQIHGTIAQCVNLASGNLEGIRSGGKSLREGGAVRNALLAVAMARNGTPGGETVLEGEAGFYHAYTGNNAGKLSYSFTADNKASLDKITAGLGKDWMFLETLYRIYSTAGYNIAHVDVTAKLCEEHGIAPEDVDRIEAVANWLETEYPSPAFPVRSRAPGVGSTQYYSAYGVVKRGFPLLKFVEHGYGPEDPSAVLELMHRVTIVPSHRHTLFGPTVTIHLKDGRSVTRAGTGREFIWDFDEEVRRIREIVPGIPIPEAQYEELIAACRKLDGLDKAATLIALTMVRK